MDLKPAGLSRQDAQTWEPRREAHRSFEGASFYWLPRSSGAERIPYNKRNRVVGSAHSLVWRSQDNSLKESPKVSIWPCLVQFWATPPWSPGAARVGLSTSPRLLSAHIHLGPFPGTPALCRGGQHRGGEGGEQTGASAAVPLGSGAG